MEARQSVVPVGEAYIRCILWKSWDRLAEPFPTLAKHVFNIKKNALQSYGVGKSPPGPAVRFDQPIGMAEAGPLLERNDSVYRVHAAPSIH